MKQRKRTGPSALRRKAEARLEESAPARAPRALGDDPRLVHELRVHQIELEVQNEELRTSRQEAEARLQQYAELFDFAPIGFFRLDRQGRILESNFAGARLLDVERRALAGRPFSALVSPDAQREYMGFLAAVMAPEGGEPVSVSHEFPLLHPTRAGVWVRATGAVLAGAPGAAQTALLAIEDVTARRRAEDALRGEAQHKDEFLAALSHELRNPLAPIRLALSLLHRTPPGSEKSASTMAVLERQVTHLARIVDDLLDVTRIARGKVRLDARLLELTGLLRRTVDDHRAAFEAAGVELRVEAPPFELWVNADESRLVQVIGNLLGNALKFTDAQGSVAVQLSSEEGAAVLRVRDTGIGIPPEAMKELFLPFNQGAQGLDRSRGGLGLGLATAKGLVERHGGSIRAASEGAGRGTELTVQLPLVQPPARTAPSPAPARVHRLKVLVIEDNDDAGATLKDLLELSGHEVWVAADGHAALGLARDLQPDLVLCDVGLPGMSGYDVALALRGDELARGAFLVALSGYTQPEDVQRATASGFHRHVAKPASPAALEAVLREAAVHGASLGQV